MSSATMPRILVQHEPDMNSPLLKAAQPTWFNMLVKMDVVIADIPRCPSLHHL